MRGRQEGKAGTNVMTHVNGHMKTAGGCLGVGMCVPPTLLLLPSSCLSHGKSPPESNLASVAQQEKTEATSQAVSHLLFWV